MRCYRGGCLVWAGITVDVKMSVGACHAFVFLAKLVFDYRPPELVLMTDFKTPLKSIWTWENTNKNHPILTQRQLAVILNHGRNKWKSWTFNWKNGWFCTAQSYYRNGWTIMGGSYTSIKIINDGRQLVVHIDKFYSDNLLHKTDTLIYLLVKVTPHNALNFSRCMINWRWIIVIRGVECNFNDMLIEMLWFVLKRMHLNLFSVLPEPQQKNHIPQTENVIMLTHTEAILPETSTVKCMYEMKIIMSNTQWRGYNWISYLSFLGRLIYPEILGWNAINPANRWFPSL